MGISIRSNVSSLTAQRNLNQTQKELSQSLQRLSSGYRINKAGDDAAGLGISENLRAQIKCINQAQRNANDGISLIQTAEGALNEISSIMIRLRELAIQSANDTLITRDRSFLNSEYEALMEEVNRIASSTEFNGKFLLNGTFSASAIEFQIGLEDNTNDRISLTIANVGTGSIGDSGDGNSLNASSINSKTTSRGSLDIIDKAISDISSTRAKLGAMQNRLNSTIVNLASSSENLTAANSRIRDVNIANETANLTRSQILIQAGVSVLAQANSSPQIALSLLQG